MKRSRLTFASCLLVVSACSSTSRTVKQSDECNPGEYRCRSDQLQRCDGDGIAWEIQAQCVPGTCVEGDSSCPPAEIGNGGSSAGGSGGTSDGGATSGADSLTSGGASGSGGSAVSNGEGGSSGDNATSSSSGGVTSGDEGTSGSSGGANGGEGGTTSSGLGGDAGTTGGNGGGSGSGGTTGGQPPFCTPDPCPSDRRCDEAGRQCVCDGCVIASTCVAEGATDPNNSCRICDPSLSASAYSADVGAACGSSATECSEQDTCDANAVCQPNDVADRTTCFDGYCEAGSCEVPSFDCVAPDPPEIDSDEIEFLLQSDPPTPAGGTVKSGRYTPIRVEYYGDQPQTTTLLSFEFDGIFAQVASQPYPPWIPAVLYAGIFTPVDKSLTFDVQRCSTQVVSLPAMEYTATANGMVVFYDDAGGTRVAISYLRD